MLLLTYLLGAISWSYCAPSWPPPIKNSAYGPDSPPLGLLGDTVTRLSQSVIDLSVKV